MIKRLINNGFKDQTRTVEFSGLDLFTSSDVNGVGKSAVLEAWIQRLGRMKARGVLDNVLVAHYHSLRDAEKLSGFQEHVLEETESQLEAVSL